jgi:cell wall-associated NlpC family hydrolase
VAAYAVAYFAALAFSRQTDNNAVDANANFLKYDQMAILRLFAFAVAFSLLAGCSTTQTPPVSRPGVDASPQAVDVVMMALSLYDTGYRFGGKNPEAGVDCSGFVSYVFNKAVGYRVAGDAAAIAHQGREVRKEDLKPGDLVFFNTLGRPFSHVGIFIGNDEFIHAPSSKGTVRIDRLSNPYYASRFQAAKAILQD